MYTSSDGTSFSLVRPLEKQTGLKQDYSVEENLQIWAREPGRDPFMPNHLRIFLDIELQRRFQVTPLEEMGLVFDEVFYGADPVEVLDRHPPRKVPSHLRPLDYDLFLAQLFLAEQAGYPGKSAFDPKQLYLQGWIRCTISPDREIDHILWAAVRGGPPAAYSSIDNRMKKTKFDPNAKPLWWFQLQRPKA